MIDLFRKVANEYITYSTGQVYWRFPKADVWQLYKLSAVRYSNPFPPFRKNRERLFNYCKETFNKTDKTIVGFYLVKHTERSFQLPVEKTSHAYIPLNEIELITSKHTNLSNWLHILDLEADQFYKGKKIEHAKIINPIYYEGDTSSVVYAKPNDIYFYAEFGGAVNK